MNMIVIGCGRVGAAVAYALYKKGHKVAVVDDDAKAFSNLPADFRGHTLEGDVLTVDCLVRAGIEHAHAIAVVTPSDVINTVVAHVARTVYKVPNIMVRNYEPRKRPFQDAFGFQVISPSMWGAQRIEEKLSNPHFQTLGSSGDGEMEIVELVVPKAWDGKALVNIAPVGHFAVISVTHAGHSVLPKPNDRVAAGDIVQLSITRQAAKILRADMEKQEA
jgi:trk system potassium uptake protein TrkA